MSKNIVVCCDGTCNQFGKVNTNMVRLFQAIERHDGVQTGFYDPGVGTFAARFCGFYLGKGLGKFLGLTFGYGVQQNMEDCYRYLMDTYEDGDKVYIFGFSRGAFTARSLAAMLDKCGLLYPHHENMVPYMSEQYFGSQAADEVLDFKATFCRECVPYFVGVWDTVGSLGFLLARRKFCNNKLSPRVKLAFHAMAIDEQRGKFRPTLWDESQLLPDQTVEQVWFAGVHCDAGGGYADHELADIPFRWMLDRASEHGVRFLADVLARNRGNPLGRMHDSFTWWWHLLPPFLRRSRVIPGNAKVSPTVFERMQADPDYRPTNLPERD